MTATQKLFSPVQVGPLALSHRVVMAPLTRSRSQQPGDVPGDLMVEYYEQRASEGGLIISEATTISISGRGWFGAPGLYSDEQIAGWQKVTNAVHDKGAHMFSQLWHTGRASHLDTTNGATRWRLHPWRTRAGFDPQWLAAALTAACARHHGNSWPRRGLSPGRGAAKTPVLRARSCMRRTVISPTNFCRTAGTNHRCRWRFDREQVRFVSELCRRSRRCGAATGSRCASPANIQRNVGQNPGPLFDDPAGELYRFGLAYDIGTASEGKPAHCGAAGAYRRRTATKIFNGKIISAGGPELKTAEATIEKGDADLVAFGPISLPIPICPSA